MTKAQLKYFQSLGQAKHRKAEFKYLVEGQKSVVEWLSDGRYVDSLIVTEEWLADNDMLARAYASKIVVGLQHELDKISTLATPTSVILVAKMESTSLDAKVLDEKSWCLALDGIRDPGNMGTIIRIADWYGIKHLLLSNDCVEIYNSKVVQASMGSLLRVSVSIHDDLAATLQQSQLPKYITHLNGTDIRNLDAVTPGIIVIGNESNGVSDMVYQTATHTVLIPKVGTAESLNAAVATGIVCHALVFNLSK